MARADDIIFRIGANAKPFVSAMGGAKKALGSFLALAGAGMSVSGIKSIVSEVGNIANIADKVNLTTEALQQMRFAGEQVGVATTATDVAMQRFTRRIAEAANGSGELLKTLDANNVALRNQDKTMRPQLDILKDYADLIKNADSEQAKLLLTFKAFDTEGAALVNVLGNGSDALETMFQKATDLGVVLDDKLIRQAEELDNKYKAVAATFGTAFKDAVVGSAVAVDALAGKIEKAAAGEGRINLLTNRIASLKKALELTSKKELDLFEKMTLWAEGDAPTIISKITEAESALIALREAHEVKMGREASLSFEDGAYPAPVKKTVVSDPREIARKAAAARKAEAAARKAEAAAQRRADSIRNVVEALKHEYENLGRTAEQQKLYNSLKRAGVELDSEAGREIEDHVRILTAEQNLLSGKAFALEQQKKQAEEFKTSLDYLTQSAIDMGQGFADGSLKGIGALKSLGVELLGLLLKGKLLGQGPLAGYFGTGINTSISPAVNSAMAAGRGGLFAEGGVIGGKIVGPGTGTSDSILARNVSNGSNVFVSNGEGIVTAQGMKNNPGVLEKLNKGEKIITYEERTVISNRIDQALAAGGVVGGSAYGHNVSPTAKIYNNPINRISSIQSNSARKALSPNLDGISKMQGSLGALNAIPQMFEKLNRSANAISTVGIAKHEGNRATGDAQVAGNTYVNIKTDNDVGVQQRRRQQGLDTIMDIHVSKALKNGSATRGRLAGLGVNEKGTRT